jgi:hypothetical protein
MGRYSAGSSSDSSSNGAPAGRGSRAGKGYPADDSPPPPRYEDAEGESGLPAEDPLVLDEIDRIIGELQNRRAGESSGSPPHPWAVPYSPGTDGFGAGGEGELAGAPSGYFEEHLLGARRAVGHIQEKVEELQNTSANLRQRVSAAESEIDRITREYLFVRDQARSNAESSDPLTPSWSEGEPNEGQPSWNEDTPPLASGAFTAIHAAGGTPPVFEAFTVDRYNRTINSVKAGRTKLVALTLVLSAAVGVALLALVLYSPVVYPPLWVAALPLVWIVPIPYFLLSFRGTQRVLERNHLNLPEAR